MKNKGQRTDAINILAELGKGLAFSMLVFFISGLGCLALKIDLNLGVAQFFVIVLSNTVFIILYRKSVKLLHLKKIIIPSMGMDLSIRTCFWYALATAVAFCASIILIQLISDAVILKFRLTWHQIPALLYLITSAITEEILFRGFLFSFLRSLSGSVFSIFLSSLLFSAYHFDSYTIFGILDNFLFSTLLCLLVLKYSSLAYGSVMHITLNLLVGMSGLNIQAAKELNYLGVVFFTDGLGNDLYIIIKVIFLLFLNIYFANKLSKEKL